MTTILGRNSSEGLAGPPPQPQPLLARVWRRLRALVYTEQVTLLLPTKRATQPRPLGADYMLRSAQPEDHEDWVALLNTDEGFGHWDKERLSRDLVDKLLRPDSATLMYHQDHLIGCSAMCISDYQGKPMPTGMFLILDAAHRGQFKLSNALYRASLAHAEVAGYENVFASTFPDRFSALTLYLVNDAQPVRTSMWSFMQWRGIHKRIDDIVVRLKRRM